MNTIKNTLTITACILLLTAGQAALADTSNVGPSLEVPGGSATGQAGAPGVYPSDEITVSYADLNLQSEEDVRALYSLLQRASKQVCGGGAMTHSRSAIMKSSRLRCYRKTLTNAVNNIGNENLARLHAG